MTIKQFFAGRPASYRLFQLVKKQLKALGPVKIEVRKTQVSFGTKRKFAWVWLPQMWIKKRLADSITLTFALPRRVRHRQIAEAVQPRPRHWTHHVIIEKPSDLGREVRQWLKEAFAQSLSLCWIIALILLFSAGPTLAEDGVDYGYWCTDCGRQHGPSESCPKAGAPAPSTPDEPYDWSQPASSPTPTRSELTPAEKHRQEAAEFNRQGEELMQFGRPDEAYNKFWSAWFMEMDVPLYKSNLEQAKAALSVRQAERDTKIKEASVRLKKLIISDPSLVNARDPKTADETVVALLFLTDTRPGGLFKLNPELPFINPLREPERYKAWEEAERKRLQLEEFNQKARELDAARDRIIREENRTINRDQKRLFKVAVREFQAVRGTDPLTTFASLEARRIADPALQKKLNQIASAYWQKSDAANLQASEQAMEQMKSEVNKFFQRHPELARP
ncbi:MAG: DUF5655 domain-containing protein [Candidatus Margulisbacteria bacterium]|nr:DUF5655 domain-containing protein [Candidatus Margulisiibacteriota bacterium]